jgi:hypothetical protein
MQVPGVGGGSPHMPTIVVVLIVVGVLFGLYHVATKK